MHIDPVRSSSCMLILYRLLDSVRKIKADGGSEGVESEKTVDRSGYKEKAESRNFMMIVRKEVTEVEVKGMMIVVSLLLS